METDLKLAVIPNCIDISQQRHGLSDLSHADIAVAPSIENDEYKCPDGGILAWRAVFGSFLIYFVTFGVINSYGTFQAFYIRDYLEDYSAIAVSFIGALQISLFYLGGIWIGAVFDSIGLKPLYPIGAAGCTLSLVALSFTQPHQIWQQFLSQGVFFGLSVGFGVYPALAVVGQYFDRRRGLVMGIVAGGSSLGGVCLPIMFSRLFDSVGFAWSVRVAALITLICFGVAMLISRARLPPKPLKRAKDFVDLDGFKDIRYVMIVFGSFLVNFGLYTPHYFSEPYALKFGVPPTIYPYLLSILNGTSFFGRILGGQLADRFGRLNTLAPGTFIAGILCFALWLPFTTSAPLVAFVSLYGFFSGIFISVGPAAIAQISPIDKLGGRLGGFSGVMAIASAVGTPISGALIKTGSAAEYRNAILYAGIMVSLGGVGLGVARFYCEKRIAARW